MFTSRLATLSGPLVIKSLQQRVPVSRGVRVWKASVASHHVAANQRQAVVASRGERCDDVAASHSRTYCSDESGAAAAVMRDVSSDAVRMTDACVRRLKELCSEEGQGSDSCLRVTVEGGGCSGFQYKFSIESGQTEGDDVLIERDGARLLIDPQSMDFIKGSTIDYTVELIRSSFQVINNPQAEGGCSCGVSFAIKF